jgi:hypothetical protein
MKNVLQNITDLYRKQDTSFKFNMSMTYLLKKPLWNKEDEKEQRKQIGYKYKYYSVQYNNRLYEYPQTIDNNKTLNETLKQVEKKIKEETYLNTNRPSTEWKFDRYLHYEISVFRLQSTICYVVILPLHFYEGSNAKNIINLKIFKITYVSGDAWPLTRILNRKTIDDLRHQLKNYIEISTVKSMSPAIRV